MWGPGAPKKNLSFDGVVRPRAALFAWHDDYAGQRPEARLSRVQQFVPSMLGSKAHPQLKAKAGETRWLLFLSWTCSGLTWPPLPSATFSWAPAKASCGTRSWSTAPPTLCRCRWCRVAQPKPVGLVSGPRARRLDLPHASPRPRGVRRRVAALDSGAPPGNAGADFGPGVSLARVRMRS